MEQSSRVVWPVAQMHLASGEAELKRFEAGLASSTLTLDDLAKGPERLFLANLQGLIVGGKPVLERLWLPILEAKKPPPARRATTIVAALLRAGHLDLAAASLSHEA